jgi:hypothetical protein
MENQCNLYIVILAAVIFLILGELGGMVLCTETIARSCNEHGQFKDLSGQIYICEEKHEK